MLREESSGKSYTTAYLQHAVSKLMPLIEYKYENFCPACHIFKEKELYVLLQLYKGNGTCSEQTYTKLDADMIIHCPTCGKKLT